MLVLRETSSVSEQLRAAKNLRSEGGGEVA
jgi:hypothetical protein